MTTNWIQAARQKLASSVPQDDKAVTEAFAQQAYTAIGNRDKEIMRDPYMLGFEIVTKNEENTKLVGAFAFRVADEILLAPVFYLNGQIKGQDLLYRKGVNRFIPNTDKWVSYLLSRGQQGEGRGVDRRALDARIHLDLRQMAGSRINKWAADECCDECDKPTPSADYDPATQVITVLPPDATAKEKAEWEERGFIRRPVGKSKEACDIKALWKEAMEAWAATPPELLFADFLIDSGMQKQAAYLSERLPIFAEMIELAGSLEKRATAEGITDSPAAENAESAVQKPSGELVANEPSAKAMDSNVEQALTGAIGDVPTKLAMYLAPQPGWSETELEDFYKKGCALRDSRDMKYLSTAYTRSDMSGEWSGLAEPGIQQVTDIEGESVKCLWAPVIRPDCPGQNPAVGSAYRNDRELGSDYILLLLEGKDKGRAVHYHSGTTPADIPVFKAGGEVKPEDQDLKGKKPTAGGTYIVWLPAIQKAIGLPFIVRSVKKQDGRTIVNPGRGALVVNNDVETNEHDLNPGPGLPMIVGQDAVFIPVGAKIDYGPGNQTPENISWAELEPPLSFRPLLTGRIDSALLTTKSARVELQPAGYGRTDVLINGRRRAEDLNHPELVWKLADALRLPADQAFELADRALTEKVAFELMSPAQLEKYAATYYDRQINPDVDFQDFDYDQDMQVPIHRPQDNRAEAQVIRSQRTSPQRRYLDAGGYGGGRNRPYQPPTSIPDEQIMQMQNPLEEMTAIGQQLGLKSLLDHGAVGSLTKVFDATPFINQYVDKLENSLDYLARLLFMLFWKPKDFADTFGADDLPNLENKLIGVFLSYGDLVLELRQSAGEDKN